MSKGYFTIAQGEAYVRMAYALALSLKISQPEELSKLSIGVTEQQLAEIPAKYLEVFDTVQVIPWKDHAVNSSWKLENEWKAIYMTPYDETVKLDADMLFLSDVSNWWNAMSLTDGVFATKPQTYAGEVITSDYYRKVFTESQLPNIYTAFFYFKKNDVNYELFKLAEDIFNNWERYFYEFLMTEHRPKFVSTDVVFALAAKLLDYEDHNTIPNLSIPSFVHMKSQLQGWPSDQFMVEDWTTLAPHYFNKECQLRVGNYVQLLPFHYHVKSFLTDDKIQKMERKLGL